MEYAYGNVWVSSSLTPITSGINQETLHRVRMAMDSALVSLPNMAVWSEVGYCFTGIILLKYSINSSIYVNFNAYRQ